MIILPTFDGSNQYELLKLASELVSLDVSVVFMEGPVDLINDVPVLAMSRLVDKYDTLAKEIKETYPDLTIALYQFITDRNMIVRFGVY